MINAAIYRAVRFSYAITALVAFALLLVVTLLSSGCGTWQDGGRRTIEVSAVLVDGTDTALAHQITVVCGPVAAASPVETRGAAVDDCVRAHHFKEPQDAIHGADAALRSGQAALDAGTEATWTAQLPCLAKAVAEAITAVEAVGATIPPELASTRAIVNGYAAQCHGGS